MSGPRAELGPVVVPSAPAALEPLARPPTFSIVIPTYQSAGTVGDAIRSALAQEHAAHEVIVVDDGSTDPLEDALRPFAGRVVVVAKENGGGASALNAGARAASGEFLAILDADDAYDPRRIAALASLAQARPDLDLVTTDARFVVDGKTAGTFATNTPFATEDQRTAIFASCFVGGWPAMRLSRLLSVGGFDEGLRTGYDWDCWIRMLLAGASAGMVARPYYEYRLHPGSLTSSRVSSLWDRVELLESAASNPAVKADERPGLMREIRAHRSRAVLAEAGAGIDREAGPGRLLRLSASRGIEPKARLAALLAALLPGLARRLLPRDESAERRLASGRR